MNADRVFFATSIGCIAGVIGACTSHFPNMFQKRAEYDALIGEAAKVINEAINLSVPPSLKTVWINNLSGIPTALALISAVAFIALKVNKYVGDDLKKLHVRQIAAGVTAITVPALTFYCTGSYGLLALSALASAAPFFVTKKTGYREPASPFIASIVALVGRTECSLRENTLNWRNYASEYAKHFNEYLDYNNGAARKASKICSDMVYPFFVDMGKKIGVSALATGLGTSFGAYTAKKMGVEDKQQLQATSVIGAAATGALTFCFTKSIGLSLANAGISAITPYIPLP